MVFSFLLALIISLIEFNACLNAPTNQKLVIFVGPNKNPLNSQNGTKLNPYNDMDHVLNNFAFDPKSSDISIILTGNGKKKLPHREISRHTELNNKNLEFRYIFEFFIGKKHLNFKSKRKTTGIGFSQNSMENSKTEQPEI